jgi:hypothetical protein
MDEAFMSFEHILKRMLAFKGEIRDEENGIHSYINNVEIESPVELDVYRDEQGGLHIGSTPPLYYVNTTFLPSFHRLKFTAHISREALDGG